jgi:hypothetical protein
MPPDRSSAGPPPPWDAFLDEVDSQLSGSVELHCVGGFVLTTVYGVPRTTGDLDFTAAVPPQAATLLEEVAGPGSPLAEKYKLYLRRVGVDDLPEAYQERLREVFARRFRRLCLFALDPYDLVLSKLTRNSGKDREDVSFLVRALTLDPESLRERYQKELRPYLANQERHDLTLQIWLEDYFGR